MSEIIDDIKTQTIEITSNLGLNLSANNPRIKHTGSGTITIETISSNDSALVLSAPNGGIEILSDNITIGTSTTENTLPGNVTIHGNLTVDGDTFTNNVVIYTQEDPVFYINSGFTGVNTNDIGFIGERGTLENVGWIWNEANKEWAAIGTTDNGVDPVVDPISNYKPIKAGGLRVVTDTGNATPTVFNVAVNGAVDINTSDATNGIDIGTSPAGIPVTIGSASSTVVIAGITFSSGGGGGLNTDQVPEGTSNLYFLPSRAVAAVEDDANLVLNGAIAASFTHNSANDFTLSHNGGNGRLILTGTKAGVDAIQMNATTVGGGIDINAGSGGITLDSTGSISIDANTGSNLTVTGSGQSLVLSSVGGGSQQTVVSSDGTVSNAVQLTALYGGVAMNAGKSSTFNVNGSGESFTLSTTGGGAQQTIVSSQGTGNNALYLNASAGGFDLEGIKSSYVNVTGSNQNLTLSTAGGGITQQTILSSAGTSDRTSLTPAIVVNASAGGYDIKGVKESVIQVNGSGQGLTLQSTGGGNQQTLIRSDGTDAASAVKLYSSAGGVNITSNQSFTMDVNTNSYIQANNGSRFTINSTQASATSQVYLTSAGTASDAIYLNATGGGVTITGNKTSTIQTTALGESLILQSTGGGALQQTTLSSAGTGANAVTISASAGGVNIQGATASSLSTTVGGLTVNGKTGVDIQYNSISQANFGTDGTVTLKANNPYTITHAADSAADDLTISQTGAFDASLLLTSAGTGSDAIDLTASAGGINISSATSSSITTSSGDITINGKGGVDIKYNSVSQADFSANGTLTLKPNEPYNITHAANGTADDLTISQTGSFDASLLLTSAGTGSDAIGLSATGTGGGITINANSTLALSGSTITLTGGIIYSSPQTLSSSGAISLTNNITFLNTSSGPIIATLANGTVGQTKIIIMINNTNTVSLTPTNALGFTSIIFNGNGDSATLVYTPSGWVIVNERNTTIS